MILKTLPSSYGISWGRDEHRSAHSLGQLPSVEPLQLEVPVFLRHLSGCGTGRPAQGVLPRGGCLSAVDALASTGFEKINFAGGEPTLCPWLPDLIRGAKDLGCTTSMVTNGSRISPWWLNTVRDSLDWVTLSIESLDLYWFAYCWETIPVLSRTFSAAESWDTTTRTWIAEVEENLHLFTDGAVMARRDSGELVSVGIGIRG